MKKLMKAVLISVLTVLSVIVLSGCGSSTNNYQGTWMRTDTKDSIRTLVIEKNGNNYTVQSYSYLYDLGRPHLINNAIGNQTRIYDFSPVFKKIAGDKENAVSEKDSLVIEGPSRKTISYVEKDGSILYDGKSYIKVKDEKQLAEAKERIKEDAKKSMKEMISKNMAESKINAINFKEEETFEPIK